MPNCRQMLRKTSTRTGPGRTTSSDCRRDAEYVTSKIAASQNAIMVRGLAFQASCFPEPCDSSADYHDPSRRHNLPPSLPALSVVVACIVFAGGGLVALLIDPSSWLKATSWTFSSVAARHGLCSCYCSSIPTKPIERSSTFRRLPFAFAMSLTFAYDSLPPPRR